MTLTDVLVWTALCFAAFVVISLFVIIVVGRWASRKVKQLDDDEQNAKYAMGDFPWER